MILAKAYKQRNLTRNNAKITNTIHSEMCKFIALNV